MNATGVEKNYTTNYSSNMPPVNSGTFAGHHSESMMNGAIGESGFANSNVGIISLENIENKASKGRNYKK